MLEKFLGKENIEDGDVVLVTGGSGLFGKAIKDVVEKYELKGKWVWSSSKDCDLQDLKAVKEYFGKLKPRYVIHLAAYVGGLFRNKNPEERINFWIKNVNINNNVLLTCNELGVEKCLSCLSTCIFPDGIELPLNETVLFNGPPHPSNAPYAYAKRMLGSLSCWMNEIETIQTKYICCIPCNLYGKYDNFNIQQGHVIPGLIHKCLIAKKAQKDFICWGSGKPLRQFLYTPDAAEMALLLLLNYNAEKGEFVSITVGEEDEISIGDVARHVAKNFEYSEGLKFDTTKADGQYQKTTSNKKFMSLFPDFKFTPFEKGIKETVQWFIENYDLKKVRI